jgi:hypothetical protein
MITMYLVLSISLINVAVVIYHANVIDQPYG